MACRKGCTVRRILKEYNGTLTRFQRNAITKRIEEIKKHAQEENKKFLESIRQDAIMAGYKHPKD
jgi:hypothetical protein